MHEIQFTDPMMLPNERIKRWKESENAAFREFKRLRLQERLSVLDMDF